jgi:hypothetical protein
LQDAPQRPSSKAVASEEVRLRFCTLILGAKRERSWGVF